MADAGVTEGERLGVDLDRDGPGAPPRQNGELVFAADQLRKGEADAALGIYENFLKSQANDHPMAFVAKEGRGLVMEAKGDLEGALGVFEAMTAQDVAEQFYSDMALWHQGRLLERLDRKSDAVAVYKRYQELYPDTTRPSVAADKVRGRLAELDVPAPADADKAAPAPAKPADGGSAP